MSSTIIENNLDFAAKSMQDANLESASMKSSSNPL